MLQWLLQAGCCALQCSAVHYGCQPTIRYNTTLHWGQSISHCTMVIHLNVCGTLCLVWFGPKESKIRTFIMTMSATSKKDFVVSENIRVPGICDTEWWYRPWSAQHTTAEPRWPGPCAGQPNHNSFCADQINYRFRLKIRDIPPHHPPAQGHRTILIQVSFIHNFAWKGTIEQYEFCTALW